jgi:hypothetical protein
MAGALGTDFVPLRFTSVGFAEPRIASLELWVEVFSTDKKEGMGFGAL